MNKNGNHTMNSPTSILSNVVVARANLLMLRRSLNELRAMADGTGYLEDVQQAMRFATEADVALWRLQHRRSNPASTAARPTQARRPRVAG